MDTSQVAHLCRLFALGQPVAPPQPVSGGLLHHIWRLQTNRGTFAVKMLNPVIMRKSGMHESYRLSERVAARLAAQGIPAVAALSTADGPLQIIADSTFLVYAWIEGETFSADPLDSARARLMGGILGKIHTLPLEMSELALPEWNHFVDDDWDLLTFHAADQALSWAYPARAMMTRLCTWSRWYEQATARLNQHLVISHRDLDQKNLIWRDPLSPYLIDWEAAGLINPAMELADVALAWSGQRVGAPRKETFSAIVDAYYEAGGTLVSSGLDAIHGVMGIWLGWLLFNMRRSLGETTSSEEERQLGVRETTASLAIVRNLAECAETWASWLEARR
ncbi:MAG TPA: phosphotransferase [Ktedonobacteraceae bacterium]|nr:phosphotransferase [Ktedonobacteraceae bacterium]